MNSNVERWYSMEEICEHLGVSRDTVLIWIKKREIPASKMGRKSSLMTKRLIPNQRQLLFHQVRFLTTLKAN